MPLVSIKEELLRAQKGGYAIPLFDTYDMNSTEGMFADNMLHGGPKGHRRRPQPRHLCATKIGPS